MIDSIKIILRDFSGNFDNCKERKSRKVIENPDEKEYYNYRLPNKTKFDKHSLKVAHAKKTNTVNIIGSLRKRANHKATFNDLTKDRFERTIRNLAKDLNISYGDIRKAEFTQCEIGANINMSYPAKDILHMVVAYSSLWRDDENIDDGTLYFKTKGNPKNESKRAKLYAKDLEIAKNSHWKKREQRDEAFARMRECGNNMLRIEFTLNYHSSFQSHQMGHIETIGDLIDNYYDLYSFWTREVAKFVFFNQLDYSNAKPTPKEKYIISGLEELGFEWFVEEYRDLRSKDKKKPKDIKSARSKAYTSVLKVLDKYYDRNSYNIIDFKKDIEKFLIRKSNSESFDLPLLLGNLWNNSSLIIS